MRTIQFTFCFAVALTSLLASLTASDAQAQQAKAYPNSVRSSEHTARAKWSPTREAVSSDPALDLIPAPVRAAQKPPQARQAQPVQHSRSRVAPGHNPRTGQANSAVRTAGNRTNRNSPIQLHQQARRRTQPGTQQGAVRQAQHVVRGGSLPAPTLPAGAVINGPIIDSGIVEGDIIHESYPAHESYPLDGQVSVGCDTIGPGCGCDAAVLGGSCGCGAGGGCDSIGGCGGGCTTSCGGNCSMCGELASTEAWRPAITLRLPQDGWVSFEALHWWQDGMQLPALITTSDTGTARADAGVLGRNSTQVLFGNTNVLDDYIDGGRLRFGFWLDNCHSWGVGGEFFNIGQDSESYSATSTGDPILARPFTNILAGREDSELVAFPGVLSGTVSARAETELHGGGFHFRRLRCCQEGCKSWLFCGCPDHFCSRSETLVGYRYVQLDERVTVSEDLVSTDTANPGTFQIMDDFDTRNQFNGFDIGWKYRVTRGYWSYDTMMRLAFGNTRQTVTINGSTTINDPASPPPTTLEGGLLAQSTNIGTHKRNEFSVIPEFNANIGYQLTDRLKATFGYTFLYWSNVVRPGDQIDTIVNPEFLPPAASPITSTNNPAFAFDNTDYWVQGLSYGLEYRW